MTYRLTIQWHKKQISREFESWDNAFQTYWRIVLNLADKYGWNQLLWRLFPNGNAEVIHVYADFIIELKKQKNA